MISFRSADVVAGASHRAGMSRDRRRDPGELVPAQLGRLLPPESVVFFFESALIAQGLLPAPLQRPSDQAVLRLDRLVLPLGPLGLVTRSLQLLLPMAVEAIAFLADVLGRLEAQLQRGGFQGAKDLAGHEVIDRLRPQAVTGRSRAHLQVSFARIIRGGLARIGGVHPVATRAADHHARQQRHAPARRARRVGERAVLLEASEIRQVLIPADVRREAVLQ